MAKFVAFLRGINVGGNRKIPMSDLRRICVGKTSGTDVRSYIASGNLLFVAEGQADQYATDIAAGITAEFGFDVPVLVLEEASIYACLLYTSPSPRDLSTSRMPSSA